MALDLNHGVHFIRGGTEYFYGSYTHAVSPALAFSVGGVTRYVPFTSGGGYLKLQKNGTTYGVTSPSATVTANFTIGSVLNNKWSGTSISITNNGFAVAATITLEVDYVSGFTPTTRTKTLSLSANQASASESTSVGVQQGSKVRLKVSVFGKTYSAEKAYTPKQTSQTVSVSVTVS